MMVSFLMMSSCTLGKRYKHLSKVNRGFSHDVIILG